MTAEIHMCKDSACRRVGLRKLLENR